MHASNENIFNVLNPDEWTCQLIDYMPSHSQLFFELDRHLPNQSLYLVFQTVEFFEGPLVWKGANFRLGESDECLQLLRVTDRHLRSKDISLIQHYQLYTV